ncbi:MULTISPECIES: helix-turn-helix domain-containing protein [unclassified Streptomyces]|uniref:helix-turn-helix domain-containing protein n=1 Tax=unclassified Streptomyces TaxID=2593676 RepID=UPI00224F3F08|nr:MULTISPECIES: helix-turn-helix domain-containing protein [unclassified Streptomyces]WSP53020.1 helix-turn-helix domain-containing protein [Streptomyces sp. NBC_01241]MCX4792057.1 helix-turn-helix domain-containing protein [Streptomyces sp. NBC_01221]MCX4800024.1 helix-turn-helix domain-containing protein [Streptomyces sp. NBC_01242]WSJ40582.1 helix-turn-helix domain-containing protein [Streptomyces sp. NBC_01321]WSP53263.1 helix-turn-helix domain-containing protein [Streptomyces sp. NBC_012
MPGAGRFGRSVAARARGARLGRPPAMTEEQVRHARDLLTHPENSVSSIAKFLGVSRDTICKYVPELKGGRLALAEPTGAAALPRPAQSAK